MKIRHTKIKYEAIYRQTNILKIYMKVQVNRMGTLILCRGNRVYKLLPSFTEAPVNNFLKIQNYPFILSDQKRTQRFTNKGTCGKISNNGVKW